MNILKQFISETVWDVKYRYRQDGRIHDQTVEETWSRVANAIAQAEPIEERRQWETAFYGILENFRYLPGGRILAGAGTVHKVTLFNCFVMDIAEDSLPGIFQGLSEGALTLQQGGGVGYDFSVLRPQGDPAEKTGITASGPVAFMQIWDTTCHVLVSTGARRGAMMGVLRCDHPDIETFITAKSDPLLLRHFNVSVMVTDEFMQAVKQDEDWALVFPSHRTVGKNDEIIMRRWGNALTAVPCRVYRRVRARALWEKIIKSAYDYAEPGVLFADTINRMNTLWYREQINATNPCGEIPLPAYGACNLGALNLTQFVQSPFTGAARLDWQGIEETVKIATRFQDNVIEVSQYPLSRQQEQALGTRRIGLGVTGLADAFVMLGIQYGSAKSLTLAREIMKKVAETTWLASIELAREKGKFPFYTPEYLAGTFVKTLDEDIQKLLRQHGVRNSHHNTIAPAGTISLLANNISNGIEPIFKGDYVRHVQTSGGSNAFTVQDYALRLWRELHPNIKSLPPAWRDTDSLTVESHLQVQAVMQVFVDNAISKTINIPEDFPFEKLAAVYTQAYELGLKGCTVFRPNPITGSVLEATAAEIPPVEQCCQFDE